AGRWRRIGRVRFAISAASPVCHSSSNSGAAELRSRAVAYWTAALGTRRRSPVLTFARPPSGDSSSQGWSARAGEWLSDAGEARVRGTVRACLHDGHGSEAQTRAVVRTRVHGLPRWARPRP